MTTSSQKAQARQVLEAQRCGRRRQVLLIGFDEDQERVLSDRLEAMSLRIDPYREPFDAMSALIDDPRGWIACVVDARAFGSRLDLARYLHLVAFEGPDLGILLGNAGPEVAARKLGARTSEICVAIGDILAGEAFEAAMTEVLARRGLALPTPVAAPVPANGRPLWPRRRRPATHLRNRPGRARIPAGGYRPPVMPALA